MAKNNFMQKWYDHVESQTLTFGWRGKSSTIDFVTIQKSKLYKWKLFVEAFCVPSAKDCPAEDCLASTIAQLKKGTSPIEMNFKWE